jgi:hypothetical protein
MKYQGRDLIWTTDNLECIRAADTTRIIITRIIIIIIIILITIRIIITTITSRIIRTIHMATTTADINKIILRVLVLGLFF